MKSKKALVLLPIIAVFALITTGLFLYNLATAEDPTFNYVGETTQLILETTERQERAFTYLDATMRHAAQKAAERQLRNHGFASESQIDQNCTELIHPVLNDTCSWDKRDDYLSIYTQEMDQRASQNPYLTAQGLQFDSTASFNPELTVTTESQTDVSVNMKQRRTRTAQQSTPSTTPFGEQIVPIQGLNNIQCPQTRSCTGLERPCATKPRVFNALKELDSYLSKHSLPITGQITQTTRTWEMQHRLHQAAQRYDNYMASCTKNNQACIKEYSERLQQRSGNTCQPTMACDPGQPDNPNRQCKHMRGNAVDISFTYQAPSQTIDLSENNKYQGILQHTLCAKFNLDIPFTSQQNYDPWHIVHQAQGCKPDNPNDKFLHEATIP